MLLGDHFVGFAESLRLIIESKTKIKCVPPGMGTAALIQGVSPEWSTFADGTSYLPAAISGASNEEEQYLQLAIQVVAYLKTWSKELAGASLLRQASEAPLEIMRAWSRRVRPYPMSTQVPAAQAWFYTISSAGIDIDLLMNEVLEARIVVGGESLFEMTLNGWLSSSVPGATAMNVLSFLYRTRKAPSALPVYRNAAVLKVAFDRALLVELSSSARSQAENLLSAQEYGLLMGLIE